MCLPSTRPHALQPQLLFLHLNATSHTSAIGLAPLLGPDPPREHRHHVATSSLPKTCPKPSPRKGPALVPARLPPAGQGRAGPSRPAPRVPPRAAPCPWRNSRRRWRGAGSGRRAGGSALPSREVPAGGARLPGREGALLSRLFTGGASRRRIPPACSSRPRAGAAAGGGKRALPQPQPGAGRGRAARGPRRLPGVGGGRTVLLLLLLLSLSPSLPRRNGPPGAGAVAAGGGGAGAR